MADSRSREDKGWEEFSVRVGGGGMGRRDGSSALARRSPLPLREERRGQGQVGRSEDGEIWN